MRYNTNPFVIPLSPPTTDQQSYLSHVWIRKKKKDIKFQVGPHGDRVSSPPIILEKSIQTSFLLSSTRVQGVIYLSWCIYRARASSRAQCCSAHVENYNSSWLWERNNYIIPMCVLVRCNAKRGERVHIGVLLCVDDSNRL